jgi:hypothetical protein
MDDSVWNTHSLKIFSKTFFEKNKQKTASGQFFNIFIENIFQKIF